MKRAPISARNDVTAQLAHQLNTKSQEPNRKLGKKIASTQDMDSIQDLVFLLQDRKAAGDAIKALYECGYEEPTLLVPHLASFIELLDNKNNRLVWGGMIAISCIAQASPKSVWPYREKIIEAIRQGSVITRDAGVTTLTAMGLAMPSYASLLAPVLMEILRQSQPKDLARLSGQILPTLTASHLLQTQRELEVRLEQMSPSARKKLQRLLQIRGEDHQDSYPK